MAKKRIATFLGTGKHLSITGNHCYAYSGKITVTNAETTLLEFTTGNYYADCNLELNYIQADADNVENFVYFNGVQVMGQVVTGGPDPNKTPTRLLIPPYTKVKVSAQNEAVGNRPHVAGLVGRIYDA